MIDKLTEINMRAQESLATVGHYKEELEELLSLDISQAEIKKYRHRNPDLSYVFKRLKKEKKLLVVGMPLYLLQREQEGIEYSKEVEDQLDDFIKWKPNYDDYMLEKREIIIPNFKVGDDVSLLGSLQGARVSQIRVLKEIIKARRKQTKFYYGDYNMEVKGCTADALPYLKYEKLNELIEQGGLMQDMGEVTEEVDSVLKRMHGPYSFNHCREKAWIPNKRWTNIVNGSKALKDDLYLALVLTFYLGIDTIEDVEKFLECFGISLSSPTEIVNSVHVSEVKQSIEAGIHYDNIIYYLRRKNNMYE